MKPGAYVLCRPISDGPAAHQFLAIVPADSSALPGFAKDIEGVRCAVLGAYNEGGFLRARPFATSDVSFLKRKIANPDDKVIQLSKIELQACLIGTEDPFLSCICRCYAKYRSFEGTKDEISYPDGSSTFAQIFNQLRSSNFNSNSWAQSLIYWAEMVFFPGKCIQDFNGFDVGNSRLIPRKYFLS